MAAPVVPIILGLTLFALASRPRRASAAPTPGTTPPKVPPPPPPVVGPGTLPGGMPGGAPGASLPGGFGWPYGTPGAAGCPPTTTPNTGILGLPEPLRTSVVTAMTSPFTTADALEAVAKQLDFCGLSVAAAEVRVRVNQIRLATGSTGGGPTSTAPPMPGWPEPSASETTGAGPLTQSDPNLQWRYVVIEGDSPIRITEKFFGPDGEGMRTPDGRYRWVELIQYNSSGPASLGKMVVGNAANPYSSKYNFSSLVPGEQIRVPKTWNPWIAKDGTMRKNATPWPPSSPVVAGYYGHGGR